MQVYFLILTLLLKLHNAKTFSPDDAAEEMGNQIAAMLNRHLVHEEVQQALNIKDFNTKYVDGIKKINQLSNNVTDLFKNIFNAVTDINILLEEIYKDNQNNSFRDTGITECCKLSGRDVQYNNRYKTQTLGNFCYRKTSTSQTQLPSYDASTALLNLMKRIESNLPEVKWQYFGTEQGNFVTYPGHKDDSCTGYDPRFRPWYVEAATPTAKDIVILFDRSGTMGYGNKPNIAKEAAITVIETLNPNDRVALVLFNNRVLPIGNCFSEELAFANPPVKKYLQDYIKGLTSFENIKYYKEPLEEAFFLFRDLEYDPNRRKSILFLTDGQCANCATVLETLSELQAAQNNSVLIMTYGIGQNMSDIDKDRLIDISNMTKYNAVAGPRSPGVFELINNTTQLRTKLGKYYNYFTESELLRPIVTVPYTDYSGLGHIFSVCLPIKTDSLKGASCVDISLMDIRNKYGFTENEETYAFIIDDTGRTLVHPMLPSPGLDVHSDPIFVNIKDIEPEAYKSGFTNMILQNISGNITVDKKFTINRGDAKYDGVEVNLQKTNYVWQKINGTNFVVCLVIMEELKANEKNFIDQKTAISFHYHISDGSLYNGNNVSFCNHNGYNSTNDFPTVQFSRNAFANPIDVNQDAVTWKEIIKYFIGTIKKSPVDINPDLRGSFDFLDEFLQTTWMQNMSPYVKTMYIGTYHGMFMVYPGQEINLEYDHTQTVWYQKARANPLSTNIFTQKNGIVTIAKALVVTENSSLEEAFTWGVMGMDISASALSNLMEFSIHTCTKDKKCLLMDDNGYLMFHSSVPDTTELQKIPLAAVEPALVKILTEEVQVLIHNYCTDYSWKEQYHTWKVDKNAFITPNGFAGIQISSNGDFISPIKGTNLYFLYLTTKYNVAQSQTCYYCPNPMNNWQFMQTCDSSSLNDNCFCTCNSTAEYQHCSNEFIKDFPTLELYDPCLRASEPEQIPQEQNTDLNLPVCFPYVCSDFLLEMDCMLNVGCKWCQADGENAQCTNFLSCPSDNASNTALIAGTLVIFVLLIVICIIIIVILRKKNIPIFHICCKEPMLKVDGIYSDIPSPYSISRTTKLPYSISGAIEFDNRGYAISPRRSDVIPSSIPNRSTSTSSDFSNTEIRYVPTDSDDARPVLIVPVLTKSPTVNIKNASNYMTMDSSGRLNPLSADTNYTDSLHPSDNSEPYYEPVANGMTVNKIPVEHSVHTGSSQHAPSTRSSSNISTPTHLSSQQHQFASPSHQNNCDIFYEVPITVGANVLTLEDVGDRCETDTDNDQLQMTPDLNNVIVNNRGPLPPVPDNSPGLPNLPCAPPLPSSSEPMTLPRSSITNSPTPIFDPPKPHNLGMKTMNSDYITTIASSLSSDYV